MNSLTRYQGDPQQRALALANIPEEELRREAMRAANERDVEALWRILEAYLVTKGRKKANVSPATLEAYRLGLERLLKHWQGENLLRPSRNAGDIFVVELQAGKHGERPLDASTIQVRLAAARAFYRALRWANATDAAPFADVAAPPNPTAPEDRRTAYPEQDIDRLLAFAGELEAVIVLLGADAGLRAAEMLSLYWSDVNMTAAKLTVRAGKGRKRRTVNLTPDALDALKAWRPQAPAERVFPFETTAAARYRLRQLCQRAGVAYLGLHSLRHSCGTWLYQQTGDLNVPRKHLGHADISTTTVYARMDDRTLKSAVQRRKRLLAPASRDAAAGD